MQLLLDESRTEYTALAGPGTGEPWLPAALGGTAPTIEEADRIHAEERAEKAAKKGRKP